MATSSSPEAQATPSRFQSAALFALVLVAGETLAALAAGADEFGLFALQAVLAFALGLGLFLLPLPRRALALLVLVGAGTLHAGFAWYDVDHRLEPGEGAQLVALAALLAAAGGLATRPRAGEPRGLLAVFASAFLVQALWCARFVFPNTDTRAAWVVPAAWASAALAPIVALFVARRLLVANSLPARTAALLLVAAPLFAGRAVFWSAHRAFVADSSARSGPARPDVLLIVLDTVRADHLSLYGYPRATSPELERLAARATVYEAAQSQAIWTLPGHASLFTGLYPSEHQADWKDGVPWVRKLWPEAVTQAERFAFDGYRTACFAANAFLTPTLGLAQGFEWLATGRSPTVYLSLPAAAMGLASLAGGPVARQQLGPLERTSTLHATEINALALEWLARTEGRGPRFLVLNYMEAHDQLRRLPCGAPRFGDGRSCVPDDLPETDDVWHGRATLAPEHAQGLVDWYDSELACLDRHLGELFDALEERGIFDGMLVAVTADHGHLLGEHEAFDHEAEVWRELTHVPLVLKRPGQTSGERCAEPVETAELAFVLPWLAGLDLARELPSSLGRADAAAARRLAGPPPAAGAPLCPLVPGARPSVSESPERFELAQGNPRYATRWIALVDGTRKYFVDKQDQVRVVDTEAPGPEEPREPTPEELARAKALLAAWRAGLIAPLGAGNATSSPTPSEDEEAAERLRLLKHQGYAGG